MTPGILRRDSVLRPRDGREPSRPRDACLQADWRRGSRRPAAHLPAVSPRHTAPRRRQAQDDEVTTPTRAAGLDALRAFVPHAGADYRRDRNHDTGPARTKRLGSVAVHPAPARHRAGGRRRRARATQPAHRGEVRAGGLLAHLLEGVARAASRGLAAATAMRSVTCSPATCPRTTRTWSPGGPGSRRWTRGCVSSSRPATCTTTRGCGSRASGSSPSSYRGSSVPTSSTGTCSTVTPPPTPCRGAGSPDCRPGEDVPGDDGEHRAVHRRPFRADRPRDRGPSA